MLWTIASVLRKSGPEGPTHVRPVKDVDTPRKSNIPPIASGFEPQAFLGYAGLLVGFR